MRRQINGSDLTVNPVGLDGASPYRIALAWFLHKGPHIIPIKLAHEDIEAIDALPRFIRDDSSTFDEPW